MPYVLEQAESSPADPLFLSLGAVAGSTVAWIGDFSRALQFARGEDAERFAQAYLMGRKARITTRDAGGKLVRAHGGYLVGAT